MITILLLLTIILILLFSAICIGYKELKTEMVALYNQMNIVLDQGNTIKKRLDDLDLMASENRELATDVFSDTKTMIDSIDSISTAIARATDDVRKNIDVAERVEDSLTEVLSLKESIDLFKASCAEQKKATDATNSFFNGLGNLWNYNPYAKKEDEDGSNE